MRMAVIADVHANLPALEAVLVAIRAESVDAIVCLGDLVGYNSEPAACVEILRDTSDFVVMGNHDLDVVRLVSHPGTNSTASLVQSWTRTQLDASALGYLGSLPNIVVEPGEFVAVHGCYLNDTHVNGYVTSTMLEENLEAIARREDWPALAMCGHTHAPLCGWLERSGCIEVRMHEPVVWPASAHAVLINPGSVGQPRDRDARAAFALVDTAARRAEVRRIAYDVERAATAIEASGLPPQLASRLREGI